MSLKSPGWASRDDWVCSVMVIDLSSWDQPLVLLVNHFWSANEKWSVGREENVETVMDMLYEASPSGIRIQDLQISQTILLLKH